MRIKNYITLLLFGAVAGASGLALSVGVILRDLELAAASSGKASEDYGHVQTLVATSSELLTVLDILTTESSGVYVVADRLTGRCRTLLAAINDSASFAGDPSISKLTISFEELVKWGQRAAYAGGDEDEKQVAAEHYEAAAQNYVSLMDEIEERASRIADQQDSGLATRRERTIWFILLACVGYISVVLVMSYWASNRLVEPVQALADRAEQAMTQDAPFELAESGPYEIRTLTRSVAQFVGALESKVAERTSALRDSEESTRLIIESALDAVITMDADGIITGWNPNAEAVFGWKKSEALHKRLSDIIVPPQHRDGHINGLENYVSGGEGKFVGKRIEITALHRDGLEFPVELAVSAMRTGGSMKFSAFVRDISERLSVARALKDAKEAAESANQAKSSFLANMSHELRTPLNAIIGYSEMLEEEAADLGEETFVADLRKIHGAGKNLLALINDVLDLSKIEAGKMELYLETIDVHSMIDDVSTTVGPLISKNNNQLEVTVNADVVSMHADLVKVRQTLLNLLSNAAKFTEGGKISISVERYELDKSDWVRFRVQDNGIGMATDQMKHLFIAFSQADASTTRKYGGTGLGLDISRRFCRMMGGDITVQSTVGVGSTFEMCVPLNVVDPKKSPTVPIATADVADDGGVSENARTVLVIDDDPVIHDLLRRTLAKEGFRVEVATTGDEGIEIAKRIHPAVITLDILMPHKDGWAVLSEIKSEPQIADIPVILMSILDDEKMGFALGASAYLTKPVNLETLVEMVRRYALERGTGSILLVEDDNGLRELERRTLEKDGWKVIEAVTGRAGLDCLDRERPALILLDLMMPELNGFEFLEELRKRRDWESIPVIVVTAKDLTQQERDELRSRVTTILDKGSYQLDELIQVIRDKADSFAGSDTRLSGG